MPGGTRIIFASNYGDPKGREFDLWAIDVAGTRLERITHGPGFDGFPLFSPDGKRLVFASNRATRARASTTRTSSSPTGSRNRSRGRRRAAADRILDDIRWLADPAREGRGIGTKGLQEAGEFIEDSLQALGLQPVGDDGGYRQPSRSALASLSSRPPRLRIAEDARRARRVPAGRVLGHGQGVGPARVRRIWARRQGTGDQRLRGDRRARQDRRRAPLRARARRSCRRPNAQRRAGDLRQKAWLARERGARALLVVDLPARPKEAPADWKPPAGRRCRRPGRVATATQGFRC